MHLRHPVVCLVVQPIADRVADRVAKNSHVSVSVLQDILYLPSDIEPSADRVAQNRDTPVVRLGWHRQQCCSTGTGSSVVVQAQNREIRLYYTTYYRVRAVLQDLLQGCHDSVPPYLHLAVCLRANIVCLVVQKQNREIFLNDFQSSTRRTRILMGFIISTVLIHGTNRKFHGLNPGT